MTIAGVQTPRLRLSFGPSPADQAVAVEERLSALTNGRRRAELEFRLNNAPQCTKIGRLPLRHGKRDAEEREPVD